jgi:hypothetical protein
MNIGVGSVVFATGVVIQEHFRRKQNGDGLLFPKRVRLRMEIRVVLPQQTVAGAGGSPWVRRSSTTRGWRNGPGAPLRRSCPIPSSWCVGVPSVEGQIALVRRLLCPGTGSPFQKGPGPLFGAGLVPPTVKEMIDAASWCRMNAATVPSPDTNALEALVDERRARLDVCDNDSGRSKKSARKSILSLTSYWSRLAASRGCPLGPTAFARERARRHTMALGRRRSRSWTERLLPAPPERKKSAWYREV